MQSNKFYKKKGDEIFGKRKIWLRRMENFSLWYHKIIKNENKSFNPRKIHE